MLGKNFVALEARNGIESVEMAHTHNPDIILMDMFMPIKDGHITCSELQSDVITGGIPLVAISGEGGLLEERLVLAMGAKGYLSRPFTKQKLQEVLSPLVKAIQVWSRSMRM
jgi:CheY-like chemotaxis protein